MDEAYKFVARKGGDTFRLMANRTDVQEAEKIIGSPFSGSAPLFFIDGMSFQSADGEKKVIPLFFEKEDLEATITKLARENPALKDSVGRRAIPQQKLQEVQIASLTGIAV